MRTKAIVFSALAFFAFSMPCAIAADQSQAPNPCEASKHVIGACYEVRARFYAYTMTADRLWPVGSKRELLAPIPPPDAPDYHGPSEIPSPFDHDLGYFGDYRVCPLDKNIGVNKGVCIVSVKNLVVRHRDDW